MLTRLTGNSVRPAVTNILAYVLKARLVEP
jgi:hypothetical protein